MVITLCDGYCSILTQSGRWNMVALTHLMSALPHQFNAGVPDPTLDVVLAPSALAGMLMRSALVSHWGETEVH